MRNVPDDLYRALVAKAKQERRSIAQQAIVLLRDLLLQENQMQEKADLLKKIAARKPFISEHDFTEIIRQDRER